MAKQELGQDNTAGAPSESFSQQAAGTPRLSARLETFDSFWQAPDDVEKGFDSFYKYYSHNYLPLFPRGKDVSILVIGCGLGYPLNLLQQQGYRQVLGIDSDVSKPLLSLSF